MPKITQPISDNHIIKLSKEKASQPDITGIPECARIKTVAEKLHCTRRHVQELMYAGKLKYYKPSNRLVLIDMDSVKALFAHPANEAVLQDRGAAK